MSADPDIFLWQLTLLFAVISIVYSGILIAVSSIYLYHARQHCQRVMRNSNARLRDANGRPFFERN